MMFGTVFCTLGQVVYNEMGVPAPKIYLSRRYSAASQPPQHHRTVSETSVPKKPLLDRMIHAIEY